MDLDWLVRAAVCGQTPISKGIYTNNICVCISTRLVLVLVGLSRRFGQMGCRKHVGLIVIGSMEKFYFAIASRALACTF